MNKRTFIQTHLKLKFLVIGIFVFLLSLLVVALFVRYRQIRSIDSYAKCDNSLGKHIVVMGQRTCITLDGRRFDYIEISKTLDRPELQIELDPATPIFRNKITYYLYLLLQSPKWLYIQTSAVLNKLADQLLIAYFQL